MTEIRIGFGSDFTLKSKKVGIATTNPKALLDVSGAAKADFNITGVATFASYNGFVAQNQNINKASTIGFGTVGVGTVCSSTKPFQFCFKSDGQEAYQTDAPLTEVDHDGTAAAPTPHGTRGFQICKKYCHNGKSKLFIDIISVYWQSTTCMVRGGPN